MLGQELGGKATAVYQSILKKAMELVGLPVESYVNHWRILPTPRCRSLRKC